MRENQPVVGGAKIVPGKPEFLEQLRLKVGHENVRRFDQPDQCVATLRTSLAIPSGSQLMLCFSVAITPRIAG